MGETGDKYDTINEHENFMLMKPKYHQDSNHAGERQNQDNIYPDKKNKANKYDVISKHRNENVSAGGILSRTEEAFFLRCFTEMILFEKDLEVQKINLSLREDFNLIDAFGMLD